MAARRSSLITRLFPKPAHKACLAMFAASAAAFAYNLSAVVWAGKTLHALYVDPSRYGFTDPYLEGLRGIRLLRGGKPAEAEPFLRKSLAADPNSTFAGELAALLLHLGRPDEAKRWCEDYMRRFPDDGRGYLLWVKIGREHGIKTAVLEARLQEGIGRISRLYEERKGIVNPIFRRHIAKKREEERALTAQLEEMRRVLRDLRSHKAHGG